MQRDSWLVLNRANRILFSSPLSVMPSIIPKTESHLVQYSGWFPPNFSDANCLSFDFQHAQINFVPTPVTQTTRMHAMKYACVELLRRIVNIRRARLAKDGWMLQSELNATKLREAQRCLQDESGSHQFPFLRLEADLRACTLEEAALYIQMKAVTAERSLLSSERLRMNSMNSIRSTETFEEVVRLHSHLSGMLTGLIVRSHGSSTSQSGHYYD